jgi:hypothetical protein
MSNCQHELQEREDACADGYCPICMAIDLRNARAALSQQAEPLVAAVRALYFAGYWHCDRPVDERSLWVAVRDAAGIEPGQTANTLGPDRTQQQQAGPVDAHESTRMYHFAIKREQRLRELIGLVVEHVESPDHDGGISNALKQRLIDEMAAPPAQPSAEPVAWLHQDDAENALSFAGAGDDKVVLAKLKDAGVWLARIDAPADDYVPRAEYERLSALVTSQGIRLMDAEDDEAVRLLREARVHSGVWLTALEADAEDEAAANMAELNERIDAYLAKVSK